MHVFVFHNFLVGVEVKGGGGGGGSSDMKMMGVFIAPFRSLNL